MVLCYVTDRHLLGEAAPSDALLRHIENAASAGIDWIQIREKDISTRELVDLTRRAIVSTHGMSIPNTPRIIVNDRIDVALATGAAGVHLSAGSIPPADAVPWLRAGNAPANFSVGLSCHSIAEALAAEQACVDYIFFGPVYDTPSKTIFGAPQGLDKLAELRSRIRVPVLAIGGITEANVPACINAGAAGIAAIRLFQRDSAASSLTETVLHLRSSA